MRKLVILTLTLIFLIALSSVAFAGGWHTIGSGTHAPDEGYWHIPGNVPHRGLQTSANNCKTCHAVHDGNASGFKLLHDDSRATECNYCHDATSGVTDKKPYSVTDPYGEHTLGAKAIPESDVVNSIQTDGLSCGNCHSVHDAYTINDTSAGTLADKLLRRDPANNGGDVLAGIESVANYGSTSPVNGPDTAAYDENEALASFCGDCHNKNVNWDRGGSGSEGDLVPPASEGERPNGNAHPIGHVDGLIDVYGRLKTVSASGRTKTCTSCHLSKGETSSSFPHQSRGHKLFGETYRDASPISNFDYTGDPYRPLPNTDAKVCRSCHSEIGKQTVGSF